MSAAAEVFDHPELLERILLYMSTFANEAVPTKGNAPIGGKRTYRSPSKELFVLQRVNRNFKATIKRNVIMQQRMFLKASQGPYIDPFSLPPANSSQDSLQWLLDEVSVQYDDRCELFGPPEQLMLCSPVHELSSMSRVKEASWRKMKLHCLSGQGPIELKLMTVVGTLFPAHIFEEDQGTTLGKLHDGLQSLMATLEDFDMCETMESWGGYPTLELRKDRKRVRRECVRDELWEDELREEDGDDDDMSEEDSEEDDSEDDSE